MNPTTKYKYELLKNGHPVFATYDEALILAAKIDFAWRTGAHGITPAGYSMLIPHKNTDKFSQFENSQAALFWGLGERIATLENVMTRREELDHTNEDLETMKARIHELRIVCDLLTGTTTP